MEIMDGYRKSMIVVAGLITVEVVYVVAELIVDFYLTISVRLYI